ncbi:MAG: Tim44 domain-containing protein [Parvibaculales bacterium]
MQNLILLIILAAILYVLFSILGTNDGAKRPDKGGKAKLIPPQKETPQAGQKAKPAKPVIVPRVENPESLTMLFPDFSEDSFLNGARGAYALIVKNFQMGTLKPIAQFISSEVRGDFQDAIKNSKPAKLAPQIDILSASIGKITLSNKKASIVVRFSAEIARQSKAESYDAPERVEDSWLFSRALGASSPIWRLEATQSEPA